MRVGLIIAMPEEVRPIARRFGRYRKEYLDSFPLYRFRFDDREICLIRSGMGKERAAAAATKLITGLHPDIVISAGLGGGVRPGLATGDVVVAGQVMCLTEGEVTGKAFIENGPLLRCLQAEFATRDFHVEDGCIVTAKGILSKDEVRRILPQGIMNPVLDMETAAVEESASRERIPFVAVRAISDPAEEDLLFSIEEITDRDLNIRIGKVLLALLRNPRILPQMIRLARNVKKAGNNLALVLEKVARMPRHL